MNDTEVSIVFSIRNRIQELGISLPSIVTKYDQKTTEIVFMDDKSTDGSKDLALGILKHHGWTNFQVFDSVRKGDGYDLMQADQTNFLVDKAQGKYLLMQSAEVAHIDHLIEPLKRHCKVGQPAFATVYNAPAREGQFLHNASRFVPPFFSTAAVGRPEVVIFEHDALAADGVNQYPNQRIDLKNCPDASLQYCEYSGILRPVPLFFCGMILKEDWLRLGGYKPQLPTDMLFWAEMAKAKFKFAFTRYLALHITHGRA